MWRKFISDAATPICESSSMAYLISSSTTSNWIPTAIPYSCSVESGLTGSKRSITRETVSAFYTNGTKTDVSNGRGPAKKQNTFSSMVSTMIGVFGSLFRISFTAVMPSTPGM